MIVGYPERLVADHGALVAAGEAAGFRTELVAPSRLSLHVDALGERVLVDGQVHRPDVVLPRGVNRPWPLLRQLFQIWQGEGCVIIPSVEAADLCADKVSTTRALAAAGVAVLPTVAVVPGDGVALDVLRGHEPLLTKPARASKARGVQDFVSVEAAHQSLRNGRALVAGMVDHHVVQPLASGAGCDYRVVVASGRVVAVTQRQAPAGEFITNRPGATVTDIADPYRDLPDVVAVATDACEVLQLEFGGVDVIMHHGQATVLEVNAWPGLAAHIRDDQLVISLLDVVTRRLRPR
jgi:[lysine-biosynthesis-protein LysW]---L-2-aminoadipate ligase